MGEGMSVGGEKEEDQGGPAPATRKAWQGLGSPGALVQKRTAARSPYSTPQAFVDSRSRPRTPPIDAVPVALRPLPRTAQLPADQKPLLRMRQPPRAGAAEPAHPPWRHCATAR